MSRRIGLFTGIFVLTTALTFDTIAKSKRLSDFLDVLSDERVSVWQKVKVWLGVWGREKD